jgi:hypothetical protein
MEDKEYSGLTIRYLDSKDTVNWLKDWIGQYAKQYYFRLVYKNSKKSRLTEIKGINMLGQYFVLNEVHQVPLLILKNNKGVWLDQLDSIEVYFKRGNIQ